MLRFHTINKEVKRKRNIGTQILKAGNYVRSLGVFRARDIVAAGYSREYLRRLVGREQVRQLGRGLYASVNFDRDTVTVNNNLTVTNGVALGTVVNAAGALYQNGGLLWVTNPGVTTLAPSLPGATPGASNSTVT